MQRHASATVIALIVVCEFGVSVFPVAAQTATQLERDVREELRGERDLRRLDVAIAGSEVTLTGELETFWLKSEAIRRAFDVDGVETVVSEIEMPPAEVAKVMQRYPYYTLFDYLDGMINGGEVTLLGKVTPDKDKADDLFERVAKIPGVQDVQNQIETITPSLGDENLRSAIAQSIFRSSHFQRFGSQANPPFHIIVQRSVVTLTGWVQGDIERREMERIVRNTQGVLRVDNQLQTVQ